MVWYTYIVCRPYLRPKKGAASMGERELPSPVSLHQPSFARERRLISSSLSHPSTILWSQHFSCFLRYFFFCYLCTGMCFLIRTFQAVWYEVTRVHAFYICTVEIRILEEGRRDEERKYSDFKRKRGRGAIVELSKCWFVAEFHSSRKYVSEKRGEDLRGYI